jgi:hypothetical protein
MRFWQFMKENLGEQEGDREAHRSVILALAGFSFSGVIAVTIVDNATMQDLKMPAYFLFISFLSYLFALNLQGYKLYRWVDQASDALIATASFSLILALLAVILAANYSTPYKVFVTSLGLLVWLIDFSIQVTLTWKYLAKKERT